MVSSGCFRLLILLFFFSAILPVYAHSFPDQFKDPKDGAMDASQWLVDRRGFMPMPIFISDPAVGYGLGAALLFFHKSEKDKQQDAETGKDEMLGLPPSISLVAGAYTENDSWFAAGGHFGSWKNDHIRYLGVAGGADINLKFYGLTDDSALDENPLKFSMNGLFLLQDIAFRISDTNLFLGGRYMFLGGKIKFDGFEDLSYILDIPVDDIDSVKDSGLGLVARYDSRDNIFSPNNGHNLGLEITRFDKALGGDYDYTQTKATTHSWWQVKDDLVLGLRLDGRFSGGSEPFWGLPYIDMRGIPSLRYQGEKVIVTEIEPRWDFTSRWSAVGFVGAGWTADDFDQMFNDPGKVAYGLGFRYLSARRLGMRGGIDVARGPEDTVVYLTVGSAW